MAHQKSNLELLVGLTAILTKIEESVKNIKAKLQDTKIQNDVKESLATTFMLLDTDQETAHQWATEIIETITTSESGLRAYYLVEKKK